MFACLPALLFCGAVLGVGPSKGLPSGVWRNYEEVFDLAMVGGRPVAATNGGLLRLNPNGWVPVESPASVRSIEGTRPLIVTLADGRSLGMDGADWIPTVKGDRTRNLETGIQINPTEPWGGNDPSFKRAFPTAPPAHVYSLLQVNVGLLAGTSSGMYLYRAGHWSKERLPTELPVTRPTGIAEVGDTYVIGGLGGLMIGKPGNWRSVSSDPIRQVARVGDEVWVVHGSGALDKILPSPEKISPDVLAGTAKRPWTSCIGRCGSLVLQGGLGGWREQTEPPVERYLPELKDDVVVSIIGRDDTRWIGTEKSGLLRYSPRGTHRWNPADGLTDPNVTALKLSPQCVLIGTAHKGLFEVAGDKITPVPSPTDRITALGRWHDKWVCGGMDGAWIKQGLNWERLLTTEEEVTSVSVVGGRLAVTTATGVYFR